MLYNLGLGHLENNTITKNAYNDEWDTSNPSHYF
jgi:GH24 family phage-related lysozyme (muramidase)